MKTPEALAQKVEQLKNGNVDAFSQIYKESYKYLHTCVIHIVKNEDSAQDMLQDTYVEIFKNIEHLKSSEDFLSWAATIANRKCFAFVKKDRDILLDEQADDGGKSNFFESVTDDESFIPENIFDNRAKIDIIRGIIDDLSDVQRACVIGFYYNGQKQDEIAVQLGIPVNTVKSHLNRAKAKIKESVGDVEKKQGEKLYAIIPFMLLLFSHESKAYAAEKAVPEMPEELTRSIRSKGVAAGDAGTKSVIAETPAKTVGIAARTKIIAAIAGVVCLGGMAGIVINRTMPAKQEETVLESQDEKAARDDQETADAEKVQYKPDEQVAEDAAQTDKAKFFAGLTDEEIRQELKKEVNAPELSREYLKKWDEEFVNSDKSVEAEELYKTNRFIKVSAPDGYVNFRKDAGTDADIICEIVNGEVLPVIDKNSNGKWLEVIYKGNTGWVAASQVTDTSDYGWLWIKNEFRPNEDAWVCDGADDNGLDEMYKSLIKVDWDNDGVSEYVICGSPFYEGIYFDMEDDILTAVCGYGRYGMGWNDIAYIDGSYWVYEATGNMGKYYNFKRYDAEHEVSDEFRYEVTFDPGEHDPENCQYTYGHDIDNMHEISEAEFNTVCGSDGLIYQGLPELSSDDDNGFLSEMQMAIEEFFAGKRPALARRQWQ